MVWIVGRDDDEGGWQFLGVFSTEAAAVARCTKPEYDFVGPVELDAVLPEEVLVWPGAFRITPGGRYYPGGAPA